MAGHNPLTSLPQEITLNIFSRLSAESVLDCKLVCRAWRSLIQIHAKTAYFSYQHVLRQHHKKYDYQMMSFVAFDRDAQAFWYLEYHVEGYNKGIHCVKTINMKFPADVCLGRLGLVGSDNGLICLSLKTDYNGIISAHRNKLENNESLCICNPITRELVILPGTLNLVKGVHVMAGFGYHPLTNEYKVVRICYAGNPWNPSCKVHTEVYTIGSGRGWRRVGKTNLKPRNIGPTAGVCVNGALHWLCGDSADIMVFDLAEEKFHLLRAPVEEMHTIRRIYVMRRCLCYEYYQHSNYGGYYDHSDDESYDYYNHPDELRLYFLEKNNEKEEDSISSYYVNAWSWNKEFTVLSKDDKKLRFFDTKMGKLVLLTNGRDHVLRYDKQPITKLFIRLVEVAKHWKAPLQHVNSFVSLEALGERNVKKLCSRKIDVKRRLKRWSSDFDRPVSPAGPGQTKKRRLIRP